MRLPEGSVLERTRIDQIIEMIEVDGKLPGKIFDELIELFDKVFGPNQLRVCMPTELRVISEKPYYEPIIESNCKLLLGVIDNKIVILHNNL